MNDRTPSCDVGGTPASETVENESTGTDRLDPDLRGGFLGFVAHEMRNPLSTALWSAELLARLTPEDRAGPRGEKLAGMALRSLQRLRLLVEDHFLSERLEVGGMPLRPEAVPLRQAIDATQGKSTWKVHVEVPDHLTAWADRSLLDRALEGLLAIVTRDGTAATVSARAVDGFVAVRIRGAPMKPDALQPPRKGTASDPTGRALAAHMATHVARALGGSLTIAGEDFLLSLPARAAESSADAS